MMQEQDLTTFRVVAVSDTGDDLGCAYYQEWRSRERGTTKAREYAAKCAKEGLWCDGTFIPPARIARIELRMDY
jgi:hypothetical protein